MRIHKLAAPGLHAAVALGELQLHFVGQRDAVLHGQLVERAGDGALHAGAVVAPDPDDQCVVQLAEFVDRVDHAADVVVGVLGEARVHLHLPGVEGLQLVRDLVPGGERLVPGRQLRIGGYHAQFLLPREGFLPQPVPPLVELALVLIRPGLRHVMGGVAAPGGEIDEERLVRVLGPHPVQPLDRLAGHRVRKVVGVLLVVVLRRRADDLLVLRQARIPLAGPAAQEAVEVVETPAGRPPVQRPGRALLPVGGQVPLTERRRAVPVVPQDTRQRRAIARKGSRVPGEPARELTDRAHADGVAVPPSQQSRPRRRAQRRDMEPVVPQAALGHPRVVRCRYRPAEGARVAETGIVDQHHQHVRRTRRRLDVPDQIPVGDRTMERPVGHPPERRPANRQPRPVRLTHRFPTSLLLTGPGRAVRADHSIRSPVVAGCACCAARRLRGWRGCRRRTARTARPRPWR